MQETPKGVAYTETSDMVGVQTWNPIMAASIDELLPWRWDDAAAMNATVGTQAGDLGYRTDEGGRVYTWTGTAWVPVKFRSEDVYGDNLQVNRQVRAVNAGNLETGFVAQRNGFETKVYATGTPANPTMGLLTYSGGAVQSVVYINGTGAFQFRHGGVTRPLPYATASGAVSITPVANSTVNVTVTLPAGRFTEIPNVFVSVDSTVPEQITGYSMSNVTTSSFRINLRRTNTTGTGIKWFAIQMTPTNTIG